MQIIPLVASQVNLSGICQIAGGAASGVINNTDHGRAVEIMKKLCGRELSLRLTIGVECESSIADALRELERFKIFVIKGNWRAVEAEFFTWRHLTLTETANKNSMLREFFCQVYMALEMLFPELMMDLIRVPDVVGQLFTLNKRY